MRNGRWVAMQFAEKGLEEGHMTPTDAVSIGSTVAARSQVLVLFTIWRADCNKRKRGRERGRERERGTKHAPDSCVGDLAIRVEHGDQLEVIDTRVLGPVQVAARVLQGKRG